ncbi:MAG: hypothetical protein WCF17_01975 [Terracidiphilus sp.]
MAYRKLTIDECLKDAAKAAKENDPDTVGVMLFTALMDYPHIRRKLAKAFGIKTR